MPQISSSQIPRSHRARDPPRLPVVRARRGRELDAWPAIARRAIARLRPLGRRFPRPRDPARHLGGNLRPRDDRAHARHQRVSPQYHAQPEFTEQVWQYINRRCSDWRVITGKERAKEYAGLLARIEKDYGVDRYIMLGLWGMESSFGDVIVNRKYMRPVIPALAALAWGEPRRRRYWEAELLNALTIVDRGWAQARRHDRLLGRRHGPYPVDAGGVAAHGRRLRPRRPHHAVRQARRFARRHRALSGRARQIPARRSLGLRGAPAAGRAAATRWRTYAQWQALGVRRADGKAFARPGDRGEALGAGAGRAGLPDRAEFLRRLFLQPVDQLHAGASAISAT